MGIGFRDADLRARWRAAAGIACAVLLLVARRIDQLTDPQVWDEEGVVLLPAFLDRGVASFLSPVNGHFIFLSKAITFLALHIGGLEHYPEVSTALSVLFTSAILAWIGTAPLFIRGGALLAVGAVLVPSDPEVLVVPLYVFWPAGLALLTLALWRTTNTSRLPARVFVALVCGLSNPIVFLLAPPGRRARAPRANAKRGAGRGGDGGLRRRTGLARRRRAERAAEPRRRRPGLREVRGLASPARLRRARLRPMVVRSRRRPRTRGCP